MPVLPPSGCRFLTASAVLFALSGCANAPAADAQDTLPLRSETAEQGTQIDTFIAEASQRYRIPERWIRAVMRAESAGNDRAVSHAGAMGLMQIMPATWAELRARYGLGSDPFDPRDNILAGTAYLREMYDRFGSPGFLAAYNAGPERYARHLGTGSPLPRETRAYIASLAPLIGGSSAPPLQAGAPVLTVDWRVAPLFVARIDRRSGDPSGANDPAADQLSDRSPDADTPLSDDLSNSLFVRPRAEGSE